MLDDVERILPLIGIREMVREGNGCRLRAFKHIAGGGRIEYTFAAHPSAGYIEVTADNASVRIYTYRGKNMKRSIERALLTLAKGLT